MRNKTPLSARLRHLSPSPTLSLDAKVKELQKNGLPIINLGLGEPDFTTPQHILKAAQKAMEKGYTHYTATPGIIELRKALADSVNKRTGAEYTATQVVVGVGSKQLLYNTFQVLLNPGEQVIVPTPTWATYIEQIKLAEGVPVLVPLTSPFKLKCSDILPFITKKTKIILLNSPSNPTGAIIEKKELKKIAELALSKNIWIVSDEIYEQLAYEKESTSIAALGKKVRSQSIVINGFSKAYAMTGWRIGYALAPQEIATALADLQTQTTSNTSSIGQYAALAALSGSQKPVLAMKKEFKKRRDFVYDQLSKHTHLEITQPEGAFYFFVSLQKYLKKGQTSQQWCQQFLNDGQVAVVPGEAFLCPGFFRLSYAASQSQLEKATKKIISFLEKKT
jgi:aspartate aminotransferase